MLPKQALILVDLQNDFCKGGNLEVPYGDAVIPLANKLQSYFDLVIATKDWHPSNHLSFASNHPHKKIGDTVMLGDVSQTLWPDHCVQNTKGAEFHPELNTKKVNQVFKKGIDEKIDSYSAFFDNAHLRSTGLYDYLKEQGIEDVYIMGLATDYCVKYSSIDAKNLGFNVFVIADGCRGVELKKGDIDAALEEMQAHGIHLINSEDIFKTFAPGITKLCG